MGWLISMDVMSRLDIKKYMEDYLCDDEFIFALRDLIKNDLFGDIFDIINGYDYVRSLRDYITYFPNELSHELLDLKVEIDDKYETVDGLEIKLYRKILRLGEI
jgi:hypothetical protein